MLSVSLLAASGLLSLAAAVPMQHEQHHHHHKRDYVWVTETDVAVVTLPVTQTVWLEPGETAPVAPGEYQPEHPSSFSHVQQSVSTPAPSPESTYVAPSTQESSTYVAPTPSSTSEYVPPPAPTTSSTSEYVPPPVPTTSSTSEYVAPTTEAPSSTWVAPTSSSSSSAPAASSPASSGGDGLGSGLAAGGTSYTGDLTWYQTGMGACGETSSSSDAIVAISHVIFDSYPAQNSNMNPVCGKTVSITGKDGSQHTATVVDRCVGCAEGDLDLSEDFFNTVTGNGDGRVPGMKWSFQ